MQLLGKKILIILAHPDDESFLTAGLIFRNWQSGGQTTLICATLGEKGKYHLHRQITATQLKYLRKEELIRVSKFLKVSHLEILTLPDGSVIKHKSKFFASILKIAETNRPDIIVSFGPDGITGHRDHIAAYR